MEIKQLRFSGLLIIVFMMLVPFAHAQVNMTATGSYTQNFNTLSQSGSSNSFTNNSTISSWYIQKESGNTNPNTYAASTGSSSTGGFYSFGSTGSSERALGQVVSGTPDDMTVGLLLRNTSGSTITNITVSYTLEQWRKGADAVQGLAFAYRTSSSIITDLTPNTSTGWNSIAGLNLNGPISSGPDDVALNGNSGSNRVSASNVSISGLSLVNGDYIMLRWLDIDSSGSDHGFGIDDVTVNYTVPSIIFLNDITTNGNSENPYSTNQVVDANAISSGISRGSGINYSSENEAYAATSWTTSGSLNSSDYFEFSITPAVGYQLNFENFDYQGQRRNGNAPEDFSFRSSLSSYGSSIGSNYSTSNTSAHNRTIDLSSGTYQNIQSEITFRLFGYNSNNSSGEFGINSFSFMGTVTMIPPTVSITTPTSICDNASGQVTITGNNLIHVTMVTVGGTSVSIDSQTNTQIVVTVPQGVSGLLTVTNAVGSSNGATITLLNAVTYFADVDADGFGDASSFVSNCTGQPLGYVANNLDCDDNLLLYEDLDEDGFGSLIIVACGGVTNNTDTNDNLLTYVDGDNDGFGSSTLAVSGVANNTDCDDSIFAINPGATEICYDGIDQNCDGMTNDGCAVITSRLRENSCNITLTSLNQVVRGDRFSETIPNGVSVTGYRFKVTNLITLQERIVERSNYIFQLTYTDFADYNTPYSVEVELRLNSEWMGTYGLACIITTPDVPNTVLTNTSCGATLVQMNNIIRAVVVPSALNYEYNVALIEGGFAVESTTLVRSGESFNLLQLTGISIKYASEYRVTIRVEVPTSSGPQWSTTAGAACSVYTPLAPEASIEGCGSEAGLAPTSLSSIVYASAVGGATNYRFTLTDGIGYSQVYTTSSRYFRLSNFDALAALTLGGTYSVLVEVAIYGNYYPGKDCNLLIPGGSGRPAEPITRTNDKPEDMLMGEFKAVAYPNPFANTFAIDVRSNNTIPVSLSIYDMTGRLLETREIKADGLSDQAIGERYPTGIYNVIVNQGENTQTIRVVKQ